MLKIRKAGTEDIQSIKAIDHIVPLEENRCRAIESSVESGCTYVMEVNNEIIGYGITKHNFFGCSFIETVYLKEEYRNKGCGPKLLKHIEGEALTNKIFTSTNKSNVQMQRVLQREGWQESGYFD